MITPSLEPRVSHQRAPSSMKVLVSRPRAAKADPPREVRRLDYCWTEDGEILAPPPLVCADVDTCGCAWSFVGVRSAKSATWGVVEERSLDNVSSSVCFGRYLAGHSELDGFGAMIFDDLRDAAARIRDLPVGTVLGIFSTTDDEYSLFDRTPSGPVGAVRGISRQH